MMLKRQQMFLSYSGKVVLAAVACAWLLTAQQARFYPPDVDPESHFRLPLPKRENLDETGKRVYDDTVKPGTRSVAGLRGPTGIRLYSPKVAELTNAMGYGIRFESSIPDDLRELVILSTARELNNQFEWAAHESIALKLGVPQKTVDIIKFRYSTIALPEKQDLVIRLTREVFRTRKVQPATFAQARKVFGEKELVNITALAGYYSATAVLLDVFDMQLEPDQRPLLPLP
ncbi:MAG: carboxymuconolactone decarboxylase family protein [Bryobacteraceae bacterium]